MFRTHFIEGNLAEKTMFRLYCNTLTRITALSKKIYFCSEFARNKKNLRKTWEIIRSALPCKPNREPLVAFKETQDPNVIANQFNDYFCSIGVKTMEHAMRASVVPIIEKTIIGNQFFIKLVLLFSICGG